MQMTRSIEERPCLTWPDRGPAGPSGFVKEPWRKLPCRGEACALEVLPQAFRGPVPILSLRSVSGEVVRIFQVGRDVALLLFSWPSVATLFFLTRLLKLERRPREYRPLDLCWRVGQTPMCDQKRTEETPAPLRPSGFQWSYLKCRAGFRNLKDPCPQPCEGEGAHLHNLLLLPSGPLKCHGVELTGAHFWMEGERWWGECLTALRVQVELLPVLQPTCCGVF